MTSLRSLTLGSGLQRLLLAVAWTVYCGAALAEETPPAAKLHSDANQQRCTDCHTCTKPTADNLCLRPCTRLAEQQLVESLEAKEGPRLVILDELEDLYLPVPFDHAGHAKMARMANGCVTCHHYTPEGAAHPACKTCHSTEPGEGTIRQPGLKGAYHRQCMSCHREWGGETSCSICHHPKTTPGPAEPSALPTPGDLIGRMHQPIPEPDSVVYKTEDVGQVLFRHKEHIHRYGLTCAECHHEDNCNRCHEERTGQERPERSFEEHHQPCFACHQDDSCARCHFEADEEPPPPFEHVSTGWPLGRYHAARSCRDCHKKVPFTRLETSCTSCHTDWSVGNFDHAVTGLRLDASHAAFDCEFCHVNEAFHKPPTCTECHDEEDGIVYPAARPGDVVSAQ